MSIAIFYLKSTEPKDNNSNNVDNELNGETTLELVSKVILLEDTQLQEALKKCEELRRRDDVCHVVISSEMTNMVGKFGVTSIENGLNVDGTEYTWSKSGRAGKMKRSDQFKVHTKDV